MLEFYLLSFPFCRLKLLPSVLPLVLHNFKLLKTNFRLESMYLPTFSSFLQWLAKSINLTHSSMSTSRIIKTISRRLRLGSSHRGWNRHRITLGIVKLWNRHRITLGTVKLWLTCPERKKYLNNITARKHSLPNYSFYKKNNNKFNSQNQRWLEQNFVYYHIKVFYKFRVLDANRKAGSDS